MDDQSAERTVESLQAHHGKLLCWERPSTGADEHPGPRGTRRKARCAHTRAQARRRSIAHTPNNPNLNTRRSPFDPISSPLMRASFGLW
jgi:hypothetical protein